MISLLSEKSSSDIINTTIIVENINDKEINEIVRQNDNSDCLSVNNEDSCNYVVETLEEEVVLEDYKLFFKTEDNLFCCKKCEKMFKNRSLCELHVIKHQEIKKCSLCDEEFKCKNSNLT